VRVESIEQMLARDGQKVDEFLALVTEEVRESACVCVGASSVPPTVVPVDSGGRRHKSVAHVGAGACGWPPRPSA
jgi:hypothetical protein